MDAVLLARLQFALTAGFHFIFPPLTIGLSWIIVWMMWRYLRTDSPLYRSMCRFWIKAFGMSFAVGVATGITLEFQFGTNWSQYSRFVGDIFGAPLAAEGVFAFFLESTFLGVLLLGWNRVSKGVHFFSALMVALGSTLSAFWIIVANSWQQTPAGYEIIGGRAQLTDFWAAVFNPSTLPRYFHTIDGALITGAMFAMGISAWFLLKERHEAFAKETFRIALMVAFVASVAQFGFGHIHGVQVAQTQPEKLAAGQGLFETQARAPSLIFGFPDQGRETVHLAVQIPGLLSRLAHGDVNAEVTGLKDFYPKSEWPPVALTFYTFHSMIVLALYFIAFTATGVYLLRKGRVFTHARYLRMALWSIPLPFVANEVGWICAEVGRQPWAVHRILKTSDAVSITVPAWQILVSILVLCAIYGLLFYCWLHFLKKHLNHAPELAEAQEEVAA